MQSPVQALLFRRWPILARRAPARRLVARSRCASTAAEPASKARDDQQERLASWERAVGSDDRLQGSSTTSKEAAQVDAEQASASSRADGATAASPAGTSSASRDPTDTVIELGGARGDSLHSSDTLRSSSAPTLPAFSPTQQRINAHIQALQAQLVEARRALADRAGHLSRRADAEFGRLGGRINEVTGYREVEAMKVVVVEREHALTRLREAARAAKEAYDSAVTARSDSQREVTSLLERKHAWTDADVASFTTLVRRDHASNLAVSQAKAALTHADLAVEQAFDALMKGILERYHEEQVWSDKIRSVSTYGSLVVLGINLVVFLGAIIVVEPWKRRRLVRGLEERMSGMMSELEGKVEREVGAVAEAVREGRRVEAGPALAVAANPGVGGVLAESRQKAIQPPDQDDRPASEGPAAQVHPRPLASPQNSALDTLHRLSARIWALPVLHDVLPGQKQSRDAITSALLGAIGGGVVVGCGVLAALRRSS